jgi:hypothetical protein
MKHRPCAHAQDMIDTGVIYQYCRDCGAVRYAPHHKANDDWHSCAHCELPGPYKANV